MLIELVCHCHGHAKRSRLRQHVGVVEHLAVCSSVLINVGSFLDLVFSVTHYVFFIVASLRKLGNRPIMPLMTRDKTWTSRDKKGTSRDKTGTVGTKKGQ